jgi:hypothetical protein
MKNLVNAKKHAEIILAEDHSENKKDLKKLI